MAWKDILKNDMSEIKEMLLQVFKDAGLEESAVISDTVGEMAFSPRGKEPERMYDRHFYFLMVHPRKDEFMAEIPKVGMGHKFETYPISTVEEAEEVAQEYRERHQKAVDTYKR